MDEANRGCLEARFLEVVATSIDGLALPDGIEPLRESRRLRQAFETQMGAAEAEA